MKKEIKNLEIIDFAAEGNGIGKVDGKAFFAPYTAPGDVVDLRIVRKKKSYLLGRVTKYRKFGDVRTRPFCDHFGLCGGCQWQHVPYKEQLKFKDQQVKDQLERIGEVNVKTIKPIQPSPLQVNYRNKMEFSFSDSRWLDQSEIDSGHKLQRSGLGFHLPGRFDKILDLKTCHLQDDLGNQIRNWVKEFAIGSGKAFYNQRNHSGYWRTLMMRNTSQNQWMVLLQVTEENKKLIAQFSQELNERFPEVISFQYAINKKKNDSIYDLEIQPGFGPDHILETLGHIKFKIGAKSFFQTNFEQAKNIYDKVDELAGLQGEELVWDLYCGVGSIGLYIAKNCKEVIGIETVERAVIDAKNNAALNSIKNAKFIHSDSKEIFKGQNKILSKKPDLVILDPPREGLHTDVVQGLLELEPERIIYVSCKPSTQARDLKELKRKYNVEFSQSFDMFPHTHHVECAVLLELRK